MSLCGHSSSVLRACPRRHIRSNLSSTIVLSRPLHCTASRHAARSPAVRRAQAAKARPGASTDYLVTTPVQGKVETRLQSLDEQGIAAWEQVVRSGSMSKTVSKETFLSIAKQLLENAHRQAPSAAAVQSISNDVDLVFKISHFISPGNPSLREWALSACTLAGARVPSLITAARSLSTTSSKPAPPQTKLLQQVETFALRDHDPRAMLLLAKALARRGQHAAALSLVEQVLSMISPTRRRPLPDEEFMLPGITSPWQTYLSLKAEAGTLDDAERERVLRTAADNYHDPAALAQYARLRLDLAADRDAYEEYMSMAAMAGHADACRRLANFYYLTSARRFPRRGAKTTTASAPDAEEVEADDQGVLARWLPRFYAPKPHAEYRALALDWYRLAASHASTAPAAKGDVLSKTALAVAVIVREEGIVARRADRLDQAFQWLQRVGDVPAVASFVRQLKLKWDDEGFLPAVPEEVVDV
ncbi:hypothetical protein ATEIFO6365_0003075200 [Aspergillus terreus]|uniref:Uncharacterized protein n=1 Tax=Aspergillus terreus TaxID=33178 RepID=A0A5M3YWM0_ASPTE|nr:hypothetical protein ATETN484_0003069800 [Aspergillus terreus]GFF14684.1 hypothetical protein ATEIFO6365_0003075200 [Aspergillus terreus]